MFYSHEILTSREHGVATIWLVATLGSRSALKKVSRRAILGVDVSRACETIASPDTPLALRLQSSLLQVSYLRSLHDKLRVSSLTMRDMQIDNALVFTSNEQLNLPVDPSFDLNLDIGFDLSVISSPSTIDQLSSLSPHSLFPSHSSMLQSGGGPRELQLQFSPSEMLSNNTADSGIDFDMGSIPVQSSYEGSALDEPGIDQNPFFEITDDDVIVDRSGGLTAIGDTVVPIADTGHVVPLQTVNQQDSRVSNPMISQKTLDFGHDDSFMPIDIGSDTVLHSAQISRPLEIATTSDIADLSKAYAPFLDSTKTADEPRAEALQRQRARPLRLLQPDQLTELSNGELRAWQDNYIDNMMEIRMEKASKQSLTQAKSNAAFWVLEQGIGGASISFRGDRERHPLSAFSGHALLGALMGTNFRMAGRKRVYDELAAEVTQDEVRAQRLRTTSEPNVARGDSQVVTFDDDHDGMLLDLDNEMESQRGRQPASSLKDYPSSMPWNLLSSSYRDTIRGSARPVIVSSVHSTGRNIGPPITWRRYSRLVSASPLDGKGKTSLRLGSLDLPSGMASSDPDSGDFQDPYKELTGDSSEEFQLYGPAAPVSTQQAAESEWLATTLENEAHNFLVFLDARVTQASHSDGASTSITFATLLPPEEHSNVVAAQAILHVLALASKDRIKVQQDEAFGDILLRIVE